MAWRFKEKLKLGVRIPSGSRGFRREFCVGRMKKRKAESRKRERRDDPCGRPGARRTDCHSQCAHWLRNDGLFARGTVGQRDTWAPPYTALLCRGRCLHRPGGTDFQVARRAACGRPCPPGSAHSLWCVGEGLSCPPPPPTHNGGVLQVLGDIGERVWAGQGEDGTV